MRYRLMATFQGSPFEAGVGPTDADVVLFAACPPPEDMGFEPATGHWRRQLTAADVEEVWESRPVGMFRGARCVVLDDLGDRLHISYLGRDAYEAERLGYWQVDRGVYEVIAARPEVTGIIEEQTEYPHRPAAPAYPPAESSIYVFSAPAEAGPGYLPPGPIDSPAGAEHVADDRRIAERPPLEVGGVTLPAAAEAPLPVEAEALRAATQSRFGSSEVPADLPEPTPPSPEPTPPSPEPTPPGPEPTRPSPGAGPGAGDTFAELARLAGIPDNAYSVGAEVEGAMCLVPAGDGYEVFRFAGGGRQEPRAFADEEAACRYLFGMLAAEAVRGGSLVPREARPGPVTSPLSPAAVPATETAAPARARQVTVRARQARGN